MKKIMLIILSIFSLSSLGANALETKGKTVLVDVPGMVCQMCVQGMKKNFSSVVADSETDVIVDLDKKTVKVTFNTNVTEELIKEKVNDAGYNAKTLTWLEAKK